MDYNIHWNLDLLRQIQYSSYFFDINKNISIFIYLLIRLIENQLIFLILTTKITSIVFEIWYIFKDRLTLMNVNLNQNHIKKKKKKKINKFHKILHSFEGKTGSSRKMFADFANVYREFNSARDGATRLSHSTKSLDQRARWNASLRCFASKRKGGKVQRLLRIKNGYLKKKKKWKESSNTCANFFRDKSKRNEDLGNERAHFVRIVTKTKSLRSLRA